MRELSITEQLIYTTTRVECKRSDGKEHIATAFFCKLYLDETHFVEVLVSNCHVFEKIERITIHVCTLNEKEEIEYPYVNYQCTIADPSFVILHPNSNIDLAIMPVRSLLDDIQTKRGKRVFYKTIESKYFANFQSNDYDAIEEVLMIGYPNGIWDDTNNRPIVRRGITATDPKVDYKGKPEFLIDCACFEGSSGSPVFFVKKGLITDKFGTVRNPQGQVVELMGIQRAIPIKQSYANIEVIQETNAKPVAKMSQPLNLGYIIKAEKLLDFIPILKTKVSYEK